MVTAVGLSGMPEFVRDALGERALRRAFGDAGLQVDTQLREGAFIPEVAVANFLGSAARQIGDSYLGVMLGRHVDIATYGAWGRYLSEGETLSACLRRLERTIDCFFSYLNFRVELAGDLVWVRHRYATSGHRHYDQIAFVTAGSVTNFVRHYAGPDWFPVIVELDIPRPSSPSAVEDILPVDIRYNADEFGLAIPRELLSLPRHGKAPRAITTTLSDVRRVRSGQSPETFEEVVAEIVRLQVLSGGVSLDAAARSLDLGVRTMQRELGRTGLHFRILTQRVRMKLARELLAETNLSVAAVAETAGYANQFNFSRAFQREVGCRPSHFRASFVLR